VQKPDNGWRGRERTGSGGGAQSRQGGLTVAELCRDYLDKAEKGLIITRRRKPKKPSTLYVDRAASSGTSSPLLGHRPVKDLTQPTSGASPRS
jgi:hypothetical protein